MYVPFKLMCLRAVLQIKALEAAGAVVCKSPAQMGVFMKQVRTSQYSYDLASIDRGVMG